MTGVYKVLSHCSEIDPQWTHEYEVPHDLWDFFWQPKISQLLPMQEKHNRCEACTAITHKFGKCPYLRVHLRSNSGQCEACIMGHNQTVKAPVTLWLVTILAKEPTVTKYTPNAPRRLLLPLPYLPLLATRLTAYMFTHHLVLVPREWWLTRQPMQEAMYADLWSTILVARFLVQYLQPCSHFRWRPLRTILWVTNLLAEM